MSMNCTRWRKMLSQARDEKLSPVQSERLHRHLSGCPACTRAQTLDTRLAEVFASEPAPTAPQGFNQAVWRRIAAAETATVRPARAGRKVGWPVWVASAAVAAAAAWLTVTWLQSPGERGPARVGPAEIQAERPAPAGSAQSVRKPQPRALQPMAVRPLTPGGQERRGPGPQPAPEPQRVAAPAAPAPAFEPARGTQPAKPAPVAAMARAAKPAGGNPLGAAAAGPATGVKAAAQNGTVRIFQNKLNLQRGEKARLEFQLGGQGRVSARIFTRDGRLVKSLLDQDLGAGTHAVEWDGSSETAGKVAAGVYVLVWKHGQDEQRFKLAVIK